MEDLGWLFEIRDLSKSTVILSYFGTGSKAYTDGGVFRLPYSVFVTLLSMFLFGSRDDCARSSFGIVDTPGAICVASECPCTCSLMSARPMPAPVEFLFF